MLRIIAGELGRRRLRAPAGSRTRPTAERVREALFGILGEPPADAAILDLYAGSGALGIEAMSRGARRGVFVERDPQVFVTLCQNLRELGLGERVSVQKLAVLPALRLLSRTDARFHYIFADPPYSSPELPELLMILKESALLAPNGLLICERAKRDAKALTDAAQRLGFPIYDERHYGDSALVFLAPAYRLRTASSESAPSLNLASPKTPLPT
jgi:16S rRNA (guanine966-N2)-methyltransferase